jgi:hypothetical protein
MQQFRSILYTFDLHFLKFLTIGDLITATFNSSLKYILKKVNIIRFVMSSTVDTNDSARPLAIDAGF